VKSLHNILEDESIVLRRSDKNGFVPKRVGCVEHTTLIKALINHAVENKKLIYILSLDFMQAFEFILHEITKTNM
jgi:hypothetical protein